MIGGHAVNAFDYGLLASMNHLADRSPVLTKVIVGIYADDLKTAFVVALLWWAWFAADGTIRQDETRARVAAGLSGGVLSVIAARVLSVALPFRVRPVSNAAAGLHFPIGADSWGQWSAFPSDYAVMFFCLTACLFPISRLLGTLALLDTVLLITFPRMFVGIHHPTDILAGALLGTGAGYAAGREPLRSILARPALMWLRVHPASFYAAAFLISYLVALVFWPAFRAVVGIGRLATLTLR
jgi:membrane-associated phospholipid phosphatase